jgi:hypothetical protein
VIPVAEFPDEAVEFVAWQEGHHIWSSTPERSPEKVYVAVSNPGLPDRASVSGGIGFVCLVVACFVLARRFLADDLRGWATFSRITGVLFLGGFFTLAAGGGSSWANLAFTAAILLAAAWVSMTSIHHYRRVARGIAG